MPGKIHSKTKWAEMIKECESSGKTQTAWCAEHGVNINTYRNKAAGIRKNAIKKNDSSQTKDSHATKEQPEEAEVQTWTEIITSGVTGNEHKTESSAIAADSPKKPCRLIIEIGAIRITAEEEYPVTRLSSLIRELAQPC